VEKKEKTSILVFQAGISKGVSTISLQSSTGNGKGNRHCMKGRLLWGGIIFFPFAPSVSERLGVKKGGGQRSCEWLKIMGGWEA